MGAPGGLVEADRVTPADRPHPFRAEIEALRQHAHADPVMTNLLRALPEFTAGLPLPHGLYLDRKAAPGIKLGKECRVSVARFMSVTARGTQLVGQCQVVSYAMGDHRSWRVKWYVHDPQAFTTRSFPEPQSWWLQVLERHFERGGDPPGLPSFVEA